MIPTIEDGCDPVENCAPNVYPAHELQVVESIRAAFKDVKDGLVEDGDGSCESVRSKHGVIRKPHQ